MTDMKRGITSMPAMVKLPLQALPEGKTSHILYVNNTRQDFFTPDGSLEKPFRSVQAAVDTVPVYDGPLWPPDLSKLYTIYLQAGAYVEDLWITKPLVLSGTSVMSAKIFGLVVTDTYLVFVDNLFIDQGSFGNADFCIISNCTFRQMSTDLNSLMRIANTDVQEDVQINHSHVDVIQCYFADTYVVGVTDEAIVNFYNTSITSFLTPVAFDGNTVSINLYGTMVAGDSTLCLDSTVNNNMSGIFGAFNVGDGVYNNYGGYPVVGP
jgi:hypothetical protein